MSIRILSNSGLLLSIRFTGDMDIQNIYSISPKNTQIRSVWLLSLSQITLVWKKNSSHEAGKSQAMRIAKEPWDPGEKDSMHDFRSSRKIFWLLIPFLYTSKYVTRKHHHHEEDLLSTRIGSLMWIVALQASPKSGRFFKNLFQNMFHSHLIITKKIIHSWADSLWWLQSQQKENRSHSSGFFLHQIFGTGFKMIVFEKPLITLV